jgi:predicted RNase H-like nuclease
VFGLPERLIYKAKKGVSVADRRTGLRTLAKLLESLGEADPPLLGPPVTVPETARGKALKGIEDSLDARLCAWVASVWARRRDRMRLFGDAVAGHIAVPTGRFV